MIGAVVIGSSTSLVVDSRRGSLARLALSGATPQQIVSTVMVQLVVVSLVCAIIGNVPALLLLQPSLAFLAFERGANYPVPAAVYALWPVLLSNLLAVGLALMAGLRQARRASRVAPVEALRQSVTGAEERMTRGKWWKAGLCVFLIVALYATIPTLAANRNKETISNMIIIAMTLLIITAALLTQLAPVVVGRLTKAWTTFVPSFDPSWDLARATTIAKAGRLTKSVVPVMMAIGLLFGIQALGDTLAASFLANDIDVGLAAGGPETLLVFLGLPLLVALSGSVGSLIMMSKQRDAELALSGIIGTTPGQRFSMPVMEGAIVTVTGAVMSLVMVAVAIGFLAIGFPAADFTVAFSFSWGLFAAAFAAALLITVAATLLPTVPSLHRPETRVIARLVAE